MRHQRRTILKTLLGSASLALLGGGILVPRRAQASWAREAFTTPGMAEAVQIALGKDKGVRSEEIIIDAPNFIKQPAIVEVKVFADIPEVNSIAILVRENMLPLAALYTLPEGTEPFITTRLDIHQTTEVLAVVRAGRKLYSNFRQIIVNDNFGSSLNTLDDYPIDYGADLLELLE